MAFEPLKAEDLALVNRLLQGHADMQETISILKQVSAKAKYPIASFDDLAHALGGENATVTFRGRTLTMSEARGAIPAYYFPIASETDLIAKVADLAKALPPLTVTHPAAITGTLESAIKLMAAGAIKPPGESAPEIAHEEILRITGFGKQKPGTGGVT